MSYTKQTWQAGDEITSAKLNHMEDGIKYVDESIQTLANNLAYIVNIRSTEEDNIYQLDKTYSEIKQAYLQGVQVIIKDELHVLFDHTLGVDHTLMYATVVGISESTSNTFTVMTTSIPFTTSTQNGYPRITLQQGGFNPSAS